MTIELHHLHPSHDDEQTRLKARIAELAQCGAVILRIMETIEKEIKQ